MWNLLNLVCLRIQIWLFEGYQITLSNTIQKIVVFMRSFLGSTLFFRADLSSLYVHCHFSLTQQGDSRELFARFRFLHLFSWMAPWQSFLWKNWNSLSNHTWHLNYPHIDQPINWKLVNYVTEPNLVSKPMTELLNEIFIVVNERLPWHLFRLSTDLPMRLSTLCWFHHRVLLLYLTPMLDLWSSIQW